MIETLRTRVGGLIVLALLLLGSVAHACPNCIGSQSDTTLKILGVFLLSPFFVAAVVIWVIRRELRRER